MGSCCSCAESSNSGELQINGTWRKRHAEHRHGKAKKKKRRRMDNQNEHFRQEDYNLRETKEPREISALEPERSHQIPESPPNYPLLDRNVFSHHPRPGGKPILEETSEQPQKARGMGRIRRTVTFVKRLSSKIFGTTIVSKRFERRLTKRAWDKPSYREKYQDVKKRR
ncbi:hypothetical protein D918_02449 [Trichuris suis]|nr:hypothetical protein D918_02449 [Trichuris suis]